MTKRLPDPAPPDPVDLGSDGLAVRIAGLWLHPVKSCAPVAVDDALTIETGFEFDRAWMVVDEHGVFLSQRTDPRMALVRPTLKSTEMVLRAPGMLALHVELDRVEAPTRATVWGDTVAAFDMGDLCAQWFGDFLGRRARLVRFDPAARRLADKRWTGALDAECAFVDGFPLLVTTTASLDALNRRLVAAGAAAVDMLRFRPNIVLDAPDGLPGLDPHAEDALDEIAFATADGPVRLKLVKPCARCPIPDVDPATGVPGRAVGDALAAYRADARLGGAITFGMNAIVLEGIECLLAVGTTGVAGYRFD